MLSCNGFIGKVLNFLSVELDRVEFDTRSALNYIFWRGLKNMFLHIFTDYVE
jgi:hypothetical protein